MPTITLPPTYSVGELEVEQLTLFGDPTSPTSEAPTAPPSDLLASLKRQKAKTAH